MRKSPAVAETSEQHSAAGVGLLSQNRIAEAESEFRRALELDERNPIASKGLGLILLETNEQKKTREAQELLERALPQMQDDAEVHNSLGRIALQQDRNSDALAFFQHARELEQNDPAYAMNAGLALGRLNRKPEAERAFRSAVEIDPEYSPARRQLGALMLEQKRYPEAKAEFERVLAEEPADSEVYNSLGRIALATDPQDSVSLFQKAIALNPQEPAYHFNVGLAHFFSKQYADAHESFRKVLELDSTYIKARQYLGAVLLEEDKLDQARSELETALSQDDSDAETHNGLGRIALRQNRYGDAVIYFGKAEKLAPREPAYHFNVGLAHFLLKQYADAHESFRKAIELGSTNVKAHQYLGAVLLEEDKLDQARSELETALSQDDSNAETHNGLGKIALRQNRYRDAVIYFEKAEKLAPHEPAYAFNRGLAFMQLANADLAEAAWRRALKIQPSYFLAYQWLGTLLFQQDRVKDARIEFEQALTFDDKNADTHNSLGRIALAEERYSEAEKYFRKASELNPSERVYFFNLGLVFYKSKRMPEAEAEFRKALKLPPPLAPAQRSLGDALFEQGRYEEARTELEKALTLDANDAETHNALGRVALAEERYPEAEKYFRKASELNPSERVYFFNLGVVFYKSKRMPEAEAEFRKALKLPPPLAPAQRSLGDALFEQGRYEEARTELEKALTLDANDAETHNALGRVALRQERKDDAEALFRQACLKNPREPAYRFNLGLSLSNLSRKAEAQKAYRRAIEVAGGSFGPARKELGALLFEEDKFDEAQVQFDAALKQEPNDADAYTWLGRIDLSQKRYEMAEQAFCRAVDLDSESPSPSPLPYLNLGVLFTFQERFDEAEERLRKADELAPDNDQFLNEFGRFYFMKKNFDTALSKFRHAARKKPSNAKAQQGILLCLIELQRFDEAESQARHLIDHDSRVLPNQDFWRIHQVLAELFLRLGKLKGEKRLFEEAIASVDDALNGSPENEKLARSKLYFTRGLINWANKEYRAARRDFDECVTLDKFNFNAKRNFERLDDALGGIRTRFLEYLAGSLAVLASGQLVLLWFLYLKGWPNISTATFSLLVPVFFAMIILSLLLPQLNKFKLGGIEAEVESSRMRTFESFKGIEMEMGVSLAPPSDILSEIEKTRASAVETRRSIELETQSTKSSKQVEKTGEGPTEMVEVADLGAKKNSPAA